MVSAPKPAAALRSPRQWLSIGVLGVTGVFGSLSVLVALSFRPFQSADENQHVSYALDLSHGLLPTLRTRVSPQIPGMHGGWTYTANHPPLFYVLQAVPLRAGIVIGHPELGFFMGRLLNVAIGMMGLIALVWLTHIVAPHRPALALIAPLMLGLLPLLVAVSGQIYNDAAAVTTSTALLASCCLLLLRGPTRRRLLTTACLSLVAASVRATGLETAGLAVLSAGVAVLLHEPRCKGWSRERSALRAMSLIAVFPIAGIGWFYLRNEHLYGDLTGAGVVVKHFSFRAIPVSTSLTSITFWAHQYRGLFGRVGQLNGWREVICVIVGIGFTVALCAAFLRLVHGHRRRKLSRKRLAVGVLLALHVFLSLAILIAYVSVGGAPFPRYALAATPVLAIAIGYGLCGLPRRLQSVTVFIGAASLCVLALGVITRELAVRNPHPHPAWATLTMGLRSNGFSAPNAVLIPLLTVLGGGLVTAIFAYAKLNDSLPEPAAGNPGKAYRRPTCELALSREHRGVLSPDRLQ